MKQSIDLEFTAQGFRCIAGADEAGRGAWAGPLVVAAVIMPVQDGLNDRPRKVLGFRTPND